MEFTINELMVAQQALKKLANERMPIKTSWALAQLIVKLDEPVRAFSYSRDALNRQYQVDMKLEDDGSLLITTKRDGDAPKYAAAFDELLALTVELEINGKIKLPNTIKVEPSVLVPLEKFIKI